MRFARELGGGSAIGTVPPPPKQQHLVMIYSDIVANKLIAREENRMKHEYNRSSGPNWYIKSEIRLNAEATVCNSTADVWRAYCDQKMWDVSPVCHRRAHNTIHFEL